MDARGLTDERGFTLVELLSVILIIGILAAIALPAFVGQADKARDAETKVDVRNAVSQMAACFAEPESYGPCPGSEYRLAVGVSLTIDSDGRGYVVSKTSETGTSFTISSRRTEGISRTCSQPGEGGCGQGGSW